MGERSIGDLARAAIAGGVTMIQVRAKDLPGGVLLEQVRVVLGVAAGTKARVMVNDRLDVALAAKAGGIHLPAEGLPIPETRRVCGRRLSIGRSVHSLAEARKAEREGADYVIFGPVFETPEKAAFGPPQGTTALRKVAEAVGIPVWAIGGIDAGNAATLQGIPIAGVAAIRALAGAADPAEAVRALARAIGASA
jgi:thiamine-phosphate pyrophosphorylase